MKKSLIIALCCITVLFAACKKEKPYEKYLGNYKGSCLIDPTISFENPMVPGQTVIQEVDDVTLPMEINITAGEADDQIIVTYKPEDQEKTYTFTGTILKTEVVDFGTVTVSEVIDGYTVNADVDMTGTLVNDIFSLSGTLNGTGYAPLFPDIPISMTGTLNAILNKQTETTK